MFDKDMEENLNVEEF